MSPFMSYCYRLISMTTTVFPIHPTAMSECLQFKSWNCRSLRHTIIKSIFFYLYVDFDFAFFSHKQIWYHERKCLFYQMKLDLQSSGYSSYSIVHMLHKILYVSSKVRRFPILSKWVGYLDPHLIRSKIWCNMIEKSYGGQNRKYRFVHFPHSFSYLFVYQKSIARDNNYNCTMKTTKMTKSISFRKLKLI